MLAAAASDSAVLCSLRRIFEISMPGLAPSRLSDSQILDATANAVTDGRLYAVVSKDDQSMVKMQNKPVRSSNIDYVRRITRMTDPTRLETFLFDDLPRMWCDAYRGMPNNDVEIVEVTDQGYQFLFDLGAERVVAAFGRTRYNPAPRDKERMGDFLGKTTSRRALNVIAARAPSPNLVAARQSMAQLSWRDRFFQMYGHRFDRGHFMSHRQGGGLDINLFPQRADINQGRGPLGAAYRKMEETCVATPVFSFSRPIYDDESWVPAELEYGIVFGPGRAPIVRTFPNR